MTRRRRPTPPERGEFAWIDFDPQAGHEQGKNRPALVLTSRAYATASGLCVACPITSKVKGYPFEVPVPTNSLGVTGVVLADQVKSLDWQAQNVVSIGPAPPDLLETVLDRIADLLEM